MLQYLHVKNLALIDEIEVEFGRGLICYASEKADGRKKCQQDQWRDGADGDA